MLIVSDNLKIRDLQIEDKCYLKKWLNSEAVLEWYEGRDKVFDEHAIEEKFYFQPKKEMIKIIIEFDNIPIGYGQIYILDKQLAREYDYEIKNKIVYGMDQFIGESEYWNQGIGTDYVKLIFEFLKKETDAEIVLTDPIIKNERAINSYEKAGFMKHHLLKNHELHEGVVWDAWIMEYKI